MITLDMRKHTHLHGPYEIVFEEVKNLGNFLEVELRQSSRASVRTEMNKIRRFIATLGLKLEEKHMGKPQMMVIKNMRRKK